MSKIAELFTAFHENQARISALLASADLDVINQKGPTACEQIREATLLVEENNKLMVQINQIYSDTLPE